MLYRKVDENGLFVEDVIFSEQPMIEQNEESIPDPYYIAEPVTHVFYYPKWNGSEWVEGLSDEEIDELTKTLSHEPTIEEQLAQTEELLQSVTMAFNEILQAIEKGDMIDE